jgi:hypothetical protein
LPGHLRFFTRRRVISKMGFKGDSLSSYSEPAESLSPKFSHTFAPTAELPASQANYSGEL